MPSAPAVRLGQPGSSCSPSLAAVVLARDEESSIRDCLQSVGWCDRLCVLVDPRTQDRTIEFAREAGAEVHTEQFVDFAAQRNVALDTFEADWIFFVDADERGTPELGAEIRLAITDASRAGWWVPRKNVIWGRWIQHAGWYPDYQMRLLKRTRARYDPARRVHELVLLDGAQGYLQNPLTHYNYTTVAEFVRKQQQYADLEARIRFEAGYLPRPHNFVLQPLREFHRRFVTLEGYRDSSHGLLLGALMAYYELVVLWRTRGLARRD